MEYSLTCNFSTVPTDVKTLYADVLRLYLLPLSFQQFMDALPLFIG
jgi:hypothetical protein